MEWWQKVLDRNCPLRIFAPHLNFLIFMNKNPNLCLVAALLLLACGAAPALAQQPSLLDVPIVFDNQTGLDPSQIFIQFMGGHPVGGHYTDTLTGGTGIDWFIFDTTPNATTNTDTITDFTSGTDKLQFSKAIFTGLSGAALGDLSSNAFWSGAGIKTAHDADDRFIYDTTTGSLYYDADGNASGSAAVLVATLGAATPLAFTDLIVIG